MESELSLFAERFYSIAEQCRVVTQPEQNRSLFYGTSGAISISIYGLCCLELRPNLLHNNSNYKTENRAKGCQEIKYSPTVRQTNSLLRILNLILQLQLPKP